MFPGFAQPFLATCVAANYGFGEEPLPVKVSAKAAREALPGGICRYSAETRPLFANANFRISLRCSASKMKPRFTLFRRARVFYAQISLPQLPEVLSRPFLGA